MQRDRRRSGMTTIELMVVLGIAAVLTTIGTITFRSWSNDQAAKTAVRGVGDLLIRARAEAIRTGTNHMVFIGQDHGGNPLVWGGRPQAAMLIADLDGDAEMDLPNEHRDALVADPAGRVAWGRSLAGVTLAPGDPFSGTALEGSVLEANTPGNFRHPTNPNLIQPWVLFMPDGTPRAAVSTGPGNPATVGTVGTGGGAVYVTNARQGTRDHAVVMQPLGSVQVVRWDRGVGAWQ